MAGVGIDERLRIRACRRWCAVSTVTRALENAYFSREKDKDEDLVGEMVIALVDAVEALQPNMREIAFDARSVP